MRRAALVVLLLCAWPAFGRAHSDLNKPDRHDDIGGRHQLSFEARPDYPTGDNPRSLATGDFNSDGALDIATGNQGYSSSGVGLGTVSVLLGTRDGEFTRAPDLSLGKAVRPMAIVAADFNGDGRIDLAVLLSPLTVREGSIVILSGLGNGTFEPTLTIPVGENSGTLIAADFNGDRRADLAALNRPLAQPGTDVPGSITLAIAQQGGEFQSTSVPVGSRPTAMAGGDFNGDGRSDLAVVTNGAAITILLDGNVQETPSLFVNRASLIVAGDIDGDARLDLAVVDDRFGATVSVMVGGGDGTFQPGQTLSAIPQPPPQAPGFATAVAIGDFNGDWQPDVAVTDAGNSIVTLLRGAGDGTVQAGPALGVGRFPVAIAAGDFDGDRRLDLATIGNANALSILAARRGRFQLAPTYSMPCCPSWLVTGDFNEDGRLDVVAANLVDSSLHALLGAGRGRFVPGPTLALQNPGPIASADLDGDGHLDLVTSHVGSGGGGTVSVALGRGDGTFGPAITVGSVPGVIVAADFNEDGIPDLAVMNNVSVSILRGVGSGRFTPGVTVGVGPDPADMALTDANGDGHLDLIVANANLNAINEPGSVSALLGHGDGTFAALPPVTVGIRPISVAIADLNGDRIPDLAVLNQSGALIPVGRPLSALLGNGDGTFFFAADVIVSGDHVVTGDFDADGRADLAVSSTDNHVALLLGNGDGTFDTGPLAGTGNDSETVIAGDFNQDGLLDLATGDYNGMTISILINTSGPDRRHKAPLFDMTTNTVK